jgi:hypothetical protein
MALTNRTAAQFLRTSGPHIYTESLMAVIVVFLRGVNVDGHHKIKMEALRALCESVRLRNVQTYV